MQRTHREHILHSGTACMYLCREHIENTFYIAVPRVCFDARFLRTHTHKYTHTHTCACVHVSVCVYVLMHVFYAHTHTSTHTHTLVRVCMCLCLCMYREYTIYNLCMYIYMYVCMYIYIWYVCLYLYVSHTGQDWSRGKAEAGGRGGKAKGRCWSKGEDLIVQAYLYI